MKVTRLGFTYNIEIDEKQFKKWIKALRSGKYKQATQKLQDVGGYCCLGLACEITIPKKYRRLNNRGCLVGGTPMDQDAAPNWLKFINDDFIHRTGTSIIEMNDNMRMSFDEIADVLELTYVKGVLEPERK